MPAFLLQGHRGARGLKPENTLPAFETALDLGVTNIEADVHLTRDGVPVLVHDAYLSTRLCRPLRECQATELGPGSAIHALSRAELRCYRADQNPCPIDFPGQDNEVTPLARQFAAQRGIDPYGVPDLADLLALAAAYAGELGEQSGKSALQRARARVVGFDLELKRVPFRPEIIGDSGLDQGCALEARIVEVVRAWDVIERTTVRSFDHRSVRLLRQLEPHLTTAVLIAGTAPVDPAQIARQAGASIYCPEYEFLDEIQVKQLHQDGIRVVPWTVNDPDDWRRLCGWNVDGITTDYPDRLAAWLRERSIEF